MIPFRTILVAADFSGIPERPSASPAQSPGEFNTRVIVLHVAEPLLADAELGMPFPWPAEGEAITRP